MELSEDAQYEALLHSPQETTIFQKNLLVTPESAQNKGWDLLDRTSQSQIKLAQKEKGKNKQKDKGKDKSGTGHRLLNILKKTIKGTEKKEEEGEVEKPTLVPFGDVVGCLAVHIKNCRNFSSQILSRLHYTNLFIRLTISNVVKITRMCTFLSQDQKNITAKFDDVKYFSVQVPRRQDDVRNNIFLELLECENTDAFPVLLGSVRVHLYEIIQKGCFTEEFQISSKTILICRVEVEFKFSYGNFGFGFSHQLKPLQKIIEPSMFMSVIPPPERTDPVSNVIMPQPLEYPAFLSPDLNVTVGKPSKVNQPSVVRLDKLQEPPRRRLEKIKKEYRTFNTWAEKSRYLENLLNPTPEQKDSEESSITEEEPETPPKLPVQVEEKLEKPAPPRVYEEVPPPPRKPPESEKMTSRFLTVPTFNLPLLNEPDYLLPMHAESEKQTYLLPPDLPFSALPTVEEKKTTPPDEQPLSPPELKSNPRYPRSVKIDTSPPEEQNGDTTGTKSPPGADKDHHHLPMVSTMDNEERGFNKTFEKATPVGYVDSVLHPLPIKPMQPPVRKAVEMEAEGGRRTGPKLPDPSQRQKNTKKKRKTVSRLTCPFTNHSNPDEPSKDCIVGVMTSQALFHYSCSDRDAAGKWPGFLEKEDRIPVEGFFVPKERLPPSVIPSYIEKVMPSQLQKVHIKDGFDPFLRNINNKVSGRKRKDHDMPKCRSSVSSEIVEHEDQDPPYPAHSKTEEPTSKAKAHEPDIITIQPLDTSSKGRLPNISVLSFERKSSTSSSPLSKSSSSTKSLAPKLILSKNLIDLVDEFFYNPIIPLNLEASKRSSGSLNRRVQVKPSSNLKDVPLDLEANKESSGSLNQCVQDKPSSSLEDVPLDLEASKKSSGSLNQRVQDKPSSSLEDLPLDLEASKRSSGSLNQCVQDKPSSSLEDLPLDLEANKDKPSSSLEDLPLDLEANKKSSGSLSQRVQDKLSSNLEDETFEKMPDSKSWSLEKNILTSKKHLSEISKGMSIDSLSEGRSGSSLGTEREQGSAKDLEEYVIKQIFTAKTSEVDTYVKSLSETKLNVQDQLPTASASSFPSQTGAPWDKKDDAEELSLSTSAVKQAMQAFSKDTLSEHGQVNMIELDKEHQGSSLVDSEKGSPAEKQKSPTEELSKSKIKLKSPSDDSVPTIPKRSSHELKVAAFTEEGQNTAPRDSDDHPSIPHTETTFPRDDQKSYQEDPDLNTILENLSNSLMSIINGSDPKILNSLLKHILSAFYKFSQSARRPPEREVQQRHDRSFTPDVEDHEEIQKDFDKADSLDQKPMLNPKLGIFLEELSKAEIKKLKSELSKHIQHYLVERLSKSGHITEEDLPKVYQNLYVMNESSGQKVFQEKYSETAKEIMSFVNNFHHHFIDKHLEIKLRSFLSEILKNYFLENLSGSKLFKETEPATILSTTPLRAESASVSVHDSDQDVSRESSESWFDINTVYPLNKSLQSSLMALSENKLLNLKTDLSKCIQTLFIEKLSKSGLLTKRQLEGINQHIHLNNPSSTPLKCMKTDLSFRDENKFVEEHSEKQSKYSKIAQKATLQKIPEARWVGTELIRKEEKGFPLHSIKENLPILTDQKSYYSKEGSHTPSLMKVQPGTSKNIQAVSMSKPSDRPMSMMFTNPRNEYGFLQLPPAENAVLKAESQDPYGGDGKIIQSNACFERTLRMKSSGKKEHISIYKLTVQGRPDARLSPYPRVLDYKMSDEEEEAARRPVFPSCQGHPSNHFSTEVGGASKLDSQRWKGNNNNNKKQSSVTFAEYQQIQTPYKKTSVLSTESYAEVPESQPFRCEVLEVETCSKPPLFPELLKRESLKPKLQRERDHFGKQRKTYSKVVKILPTTVPSSRTHLKKSIPRSLLHWTARTTIHDCSDKFDDLPPAASFRHLERTKSRMRLLGKYSGNNPNPPRHATRPNTAPEANKRQREGHTGKLRTPRLVSASLAHLNDTISQYEMHKMQPKKIKRGY
ncbi:LOW QUALITY PROTEIN: C2 calcium-dependent domain-containing protein 6 [Echinops telfairi]|uniref:LOW QUALITY PROTEIN: C2 calcium-dependent domain-containing protein 6 n=1 Tax=Echinops telfairi TaxID=9371 RepID=A0AC55DLF8_ECHTE|nr:LOW QUALITY PROTEIN: C2 calcium-dependent domain-containing protein 6 [Echinops telfairi]